MATADGNGLQRIHTLALRLEQSANPANMVELLSFSDPEDPCSSPEAHCSASELLRQYAKLLQSQEFIVDSILIGFIRPQFSGSQSVRVTRQGRKARDTLIREISGDLNPTGREWKSSDISVVAIFRWAVIHADSNTIHERWHLFIPPLLNLLDNSSTYVRSRALTILKVLLNKTSANVLRQTGLGKVFEDAVMPTLLFLPNLTPADESARLLRSAYEALFTLAEVQYPAREDQDKRTRLLDRIMRHGIIQGFFHSEDDAKIAEVLLEEIGYLICHMDINAIKHLKEIVPIFSRILCDPFSVAQPTLLVAAVKAIQSTILTCWPRMTSSVHRLVLVTAICLCWTNISEEEVVNYEARLDQVKHELKIAARMLARAVEDELDLREELRPVMRFDPSLEELFISA